MSRTPASNAPWVFGCEAIINNAKVMIDDLSGHLKFECTSAFATEDFVRT
jgi:hypothetical protein